MKDSYPNHYERAFENWLIENHIRYIAVDERKKQAFAHGKIKSFDFILYPAHGRVIIAEVKGRRFKGASLANLTAIECWVTADDIDGLTGWQKIFGNAYQAVFVFVNLVEQIDVDFDGRAFFDYADRRYIFFCVKLDDYRRFMKRRSPKWRTVTLPADKFRQCASDIHTFLNIE
jgi:hypothetical protein